MAAASRPRPGGPGGTAGMLSLDDLRKEAEAGTIDTVVTAFTDMQGRLFGKRIQVEYFLDEVVEHGVEGCNYLLALDMEMEPVPGYEMANWEKGYGDFGIAPDMATLRRIPWLDRTALVLCDVANHDGSPVVASPRQVLIAQYERAARDGLHAACSRPSSSSTSTRRATPRPTRRTTRTSRRRSPTSSTTTSSPRRWTSSTSAPIRRGMHAAGIPVEFSKGEAWYGQHEVNIRYADAVTSADRHTIYKNGVKEIAFLNGISATFMAKPSEKDIGSSCHIHSSLLDADGKSAFVDGNDEETDVFRHLPRRPCATASASWRCSIAPSINSYKRYAAESWAPTSVSWGRDNRTCGFRIVGHGQSRRVECRIPGADVNPYLGFAALLGGRARRDRERDRPRPGAEGQRLRGGRGRAVPLDPARGGRALGGQRLRPQRVRRGRPQALPQLRPVPSSGCSTRSSPTTSAGACSSAADPAVRPG